ncbi:ComF family protein [Streptomyces canus]|uniref:ComF family protein n=1 Tax=Streptomyces canus TaxID=58343 RepID=UPI002258652B|nr:ComF family protein [Streptomyces canus]MCX4859791.1 ComF family protein [Streptomyces canus]
MRGRWQDLTDLVLPAECGGCGRPRTVLCPECRAALNGAAPSRVRPVPEPPGLPVVHAAARYADSVRAVLLAHKERGALGLAGPLGTALAGAVRAAVREVCGPGVGVSAGGGGVPGAGALDRGGDVPGVEALVRGGDGPGTDGLAAGPTPGRTRSRPTAGAFLEGRWRGDGLGVPVLLVPVPSARRAVRARGHDPARRIAFAAAGELRRAGMPARVVAVLRQRRRVADQSGLNSRQRLDNLAGALTVAPGGGRLLAEGLVVLVDDLMTTGASLTEGARAVREARTRENPGPRGEQMRAGHRDQRQQGAGGSGGCRPLETGTRQGHRRPGTAGRRRGGRVVAGCDGEGTRFVYTAATRESMGERLVTVTEEDTDRERCSVTAAGVGGVHDVICAAVVAASPDSFEINRN